MEKKLPKLKVSFNSPVVLSFSIMCLIALLLGKITNDWITMQLFCIYRSSLVNPLTYVRMIGHIFGHASFSHLLGNMMMILVVGPLLEEKYGSKEIIEVILVTAVVTGLVHFIFFPHTALLGASGVVFAFILLASITGLKDGEIPLTLILVAILYLGQQIYNGIFVYDNIANLTHIIGGIVGVLSGMTMNKKD